MIAGLVQAKRADLSMSNGPCMLNTLRAVVLRCVRARVVMWGCEHKPKQDRNMIRSRKRRLAQVLHGTGQAGKAGGARRAWILWLEGVGVLERRAGWHWRRNCVNKTV
jgi:hypothetical protein